MKTKTNHPLHPDIADIVESKTPGVYKVRGFRCPIDGRRTIISGAFTTHTPPIIETDRLYACARCYCPASKFVPDESNFGAVR